MKPSDSETSGFTSIDQAAADVVLSAAFSPSGDRIALSSADHRIRVYDAGLDNSWNLVDQWRGHDAEVKWIGPSLGQAFGTIGGDNKFKLWREDPSQAPKGGRRFKCIFSQSPSNHVAYASFDIKTVKAEAWVVLITQDGLLSLLEPLEAESLVAWRETDSLFPFGQQSRSSEPSFGLSLHQAEMPCYNAVAAGLERNALSLAVSAMSAIKIFRALKPDETGYQFHEMLEIAIESSLINDLAWAPGCIRPYDLVAAACDDGVVRIFEITTPHKSDLGLNTLSKSLGVAKTRTLSLTARGAPSGIGAGLAGASRSSTRSNASSSSRIKHEWKELTNLRVDENECKPVWRVRWMHDGNALVSTGDSGTVHLWKQQLNGDFVEFADTKPS